MSNRATARKTRRADPTRAIKGPNSAVIRYVPQNAQPGGTRAHARPGKKGTLGCALSLFIIAVRRDVYRRTLEPQRLIDRFEDPHHLFTGASVGERRRAMDHTVQKVPAL